MKIKKVRAKTVKEALEKVKAELGADAVLLHTRKVTSGVFSGLRREEYEVTAGLDEAAALQPAATALLEPAPGLGGARPSRDFNHFLPTTLEKNSFGSLHDDLNLMRNAITSLSDRLKKGEEGASDVGHLREARELLRQCDMEPTHVETLMAALTERFSQSPLASRAEIRAGLIETLAGKIPCQAHVPRVSGRALRVAMVGPTGAGKTTTIAKLASHFRLREKLKVALIAADNYRIAAVEQLQSFAEIAELPVEVVFNDREMAAAVEKFENCDIVFIDTAGRSQRNADHMADLKKLLAAARPHEVHLTLSLTTKRGDLRDIATRYGEIGFHRFLFTKLDETLTFGPLYSLAAGFKKPISYVSVGQQVPDDICLADPKELARLIAVGEAHD